jgi:hypothetical protein
MQHTDKAIAEFEAWWPRQPFHEQFESMKTQMRNVWVASRRELVIELPQPFEGDDFEMYDGAELKAAIEAAGVTVRG